MPVVVTILVAVLAGCATLLLTVRAARRTELSDDAGRQRIDSTPLRYRVPEGQDPAAVLLVLHQANYSAELLEDGTERIVVVQCRNGRASDRADVRAAIARADTTIQNPVRIGPSVVFEDERNGQ